MYAIVNIAGQQFKVEKSRKMYVHRLEAEKGSSVEFNQVLMIESGNNVSIGKPYLDGASVVAKVIDHIKGEKVLVFKKKRRKGYQKLNGHRQYFTQIEIENIFKDGSAVEKTSEKKKATKKRVEPEAVKDENQNLEINE